MPIEKTIAPNIAAGAYSNTAKINDKAGIGSDKGVSFSEFLQDKVRESVDTMKGSETMSAKAVTGEADLTDVVQAVTNAELTLQTVVAVRDRLVSAYQEIMRMPI